MAKLREWLERVCTSLGTMAAEARQEVALPVSTLEAALKLRSACLYNEVQDARQDARQDRRHPKGAGGKFERNVRTPRGAPTKEVAPGGKGAGGKGVGGKAAAGKAAGGGKKRLWAEKPFIDNAQFACLKAKFAEKRADHCWFALVEQQESTEANNALLTKKATTIKRFLSNNERLIERQASRMDSNMKSERLDVVLNE